MISIRFFLVSIILVVLAVPNSAFAAKKSKKQAESEEFSFNDNKPFYFTPPKKWQCIDDKNGLPAKVDAVYVGAGKKGFTPSINIARENTEMSLEKYVETAKIYHEKQTDTVCRNLGPLQLKMDPALLLQIDKRTQWGNVRFLQASIIKDKMAYVITATCLEEDFGNFYSQFLQSFQSFCLKTPQTMQGS